VCFLSNTSSSVACFTNRKSLALTFAWLFLFPKTRYASFSGTLNTGFSPRQQKKAPQQCEVLFYGGSSGARRHNTSSSMACFTNRKSLALTFAWLFLFPKNSLCFFFGSPKYRGSRLAN